MKMQKRCLLGQARPTTVVIRLLISYRIQYWNTTHTSSIWTAGTRASNFIVINTGEEYGHFKKIRARDIRLVRGPNFLHRQAFCRIRRVYPPNSFTKGALNQIRRQISERAHFTFIFQRTRHPTELGKRPDRTGEYQCPQETARMTTGLSSHTSNIYFHESERFEPRDKVYAIQGLTSNGVDGIEIGYATDPVEIIADYLRIWNTPMTEDQRWYSAYAGLLRKATGISTERVAEFIRVDRRGDFTRVYADVEMRRIRMLHQLSNAATFGRAENTA
jgi:hypothetical protein